MTVLAKWQKAFIPKEFLDVSVICITDCDPDIQCTSPMKYVNVVLLCVCMGGVTPDSLLTLSLSYRWRMSLGQTMCIAWTHLMK